MTPLEAVARALLARRYGKPYASAHWPTILREDRLRSWRDELFDEARAAIEALAANVTPEMARIVYEMEHDSRRKGTELEVRRDALAAGIRAAD